MGQVMDTQLANIDQYADGTVATAMLAIAAAKGGDASVEKQMQTGKNVATVGQTMIAAGMTFPPWGLILSAVGATVWAVGASIEQNLIGALAGDEAASSVLRKKGASALFTQAYTQYVGLPDAQLQLALDQAQDAKGYQAREVEKAIRFIRKERIVLRQADKANILIALERQRTIATKAREDLKTRNIKAGIVLAIFAVAALGLYLISRSK